MWTVINGEVTWRSSNRISLTEHIQYMMITRAITQPNAYYPICRRRWNSVWWKSTDGINQILNKADLHNTFRPAGVVYVKEYFFCISTPLVCHMHPGSIMSRVDLTLLWCFEYQQHHIFIETTGDAVVPQRRDSTITYILISIISAVVLTKICSEFAFHYFFALFIEEKGYSFWGFNTIPSELYWEFFFSREGMITSALSLSPLILFSIPFIYLMVTKNRWPLFAGNVTPFASLTCFTGARDWTLLSTTLPSSLFWEYALTIYQARKWFIFWTIIYVIWLP